MTPSQETYRKLSRLGSGANILGALITFLYLSVIDPLPAGEASVRPLEPADITGFAIAATVIFAGAFVRKHRARASNGRFQQLTNKKGANSPASVNTLKRMVKAKVALSRSEPESFSCRPPALAAIPGAKHHHSTWLRCFHDRPRWKW